jgi:hypothetical protein
MRIEAMPGRLISRPLSSEVCAGAATAPLALARGTRYEGGLCAVRHSRMTTGIQEDR